MGELPDICDDLESLLIETVEEPTLPNWVRLRQELKEARTYMTEKQIQHFYNPMHVYCRLKKDLGYSDDDAKMMSSIYENMCGKVVYRGVK